MIEKWSFWQAVFYLLIMCIIFGPTALSLFFGSSK